MRQHGLRCLTGECRKRRPRSGCCCSGNSASQGCQGRARRATEGAHVSRGAQNRLLVKLGTSRLLRQSEWHCQLQQRGTSFRARDRLSSRSAGKLAISAVLLKLASMG
eukprot:2273002-Amphidinium_carterae.1